MFLCPLSILDKPPESYEGTHYVAMCSCGLRRYVSDVIYAICAYEREHGKPGHRLVCEPVFLLFIPKENNGIVMWLPEPTAEREAIESAVKRAEAKLKEIQSDG